MSRQAVARADYDVVTIFVGIPPFQHNVIYNYSAYERKVGQEAHA